MDKNFNLPSFRMVESNQRLISERDKSDKKLIYSVLEATFTVQRIYVLDVLKVIIPQILLIIVISAIFLYQNSNIQGRI